MGEIETIYSLVISGLQIDGEHHKQWYLEQILKHLGHDVEEMREHPTWDEGIAP